jgi:hypothetical protein
VPPPALRHLQAARERLGALLRSQTPPVIFLIWALLPAAAASPRVACATSAHPSRILRGSCTAPGACWRSNPAQEMPSRVRHGIMMTYAVPTEVHPFGKTFCRAHAALNWDVAADPNFDVGEDGVR